MLPFNSSKRCFICLKGNLTARKTTLLMQSQPLPAPKEAIPGYSVKLGFGVVSSILLRAGSFTPNAFLVLGNLAVDISVRKTAVFSDDGELVISVVVLVGFVSTSMLNTQSFSFKCQLQHSLPWLCQSMLSLLQLYLPRAKYYLRLHTSS